MSRAFEQITLVSVTGLPDARGAARALAHSLRQMPGARAVLCCPHAPDDLAPGIAFRAVAPMNYHEYSWFMMFALWHVVPTAFALVVQDDGWVVNAANWRDDFLDHDYIGAPIHLARVITPQSTYWSDRFDWASELARPDCTVIPVQNGGFSLRSRRFMRALLDYPHIRVEIPPPDAVHGDPLTMHWHHQPLLEDVQLSGVLRPALEAVGMRYAPLELSRSFSIEHAGPAIHLGWNALQLFGHHAKVRRLASLSPLTLRCGMPLSQLDDWWGERDILQVFERQGYAIEFAPEPPRATFKASAPVRKVFDCFTYNGEADLLAARLHELADVVDWFVIVEADRTFSSETKALAFNIDDARLATFRSRIRYVAVHDMPFAPNAAQEAALLDGQSQSGQHWAREKFQRNQIIRGLGDAAPDDLIMISDVDELPRAAVVRQMRDDTAHDVFGLGLAFYYFYANYRNTEGPEAASVWTVAATWAHLHTTMPDRLRMEVRSGAQAAALIGDAGWHLSYLGMSDAAVRHKIATFSHQEYNTPEMLATVDIAALTASGKDLYGRRGYVWRVVAPEEAPQWLSLQPGLQHLFLPAGPAPRTSPSTDAAAREGA